MRRECVKDQQKEKSWAWSGSSEVADRGPDSALSKGARHPRVIRRARNSTAWAGLGRWALGGTRAFSLRRPIPSWRGARSLVKGAEWGVLYDTKGSSCGTAGYRLIYRFGHRPCRRRCHRLNRPSSEHTACLPPTLRTLSAHCPLCRTTSTTF